MSSTLGAQGWTVTPTDPAVTNNLRAASADGSATPGAHTSHTPAGRCAIAALGTSVTITNSLVTPASMIQVTLATVDTTAKSAVAVAGTGSFVMTLNAAATGIVKLNWMVIN
jgi:hypothetical protein